MVSQIDKSETGNVDPRYMTNMREEYNRRMEFDRRHEMERRDEYDRRHIFDARFPFWWLLFFR